MQCEVEFDKNEVENVRERLQRIFHKKLITACLLVCLVALSAVAVWKGNLKKSYMETEESKKEVVMVSEETTEEIEETTEEENTTQDAKSVLSNQIENANLNFSKKAKMAWPVEGEIIMDFNMDQTVYHPTLKEYKCSSGVVIQSEEGTYVNSPTRCVVSEIGEDEEIGNYVKLVLGNDYELKIGQLENISVEVGDTLEEGDHIACTAKPTHYYSVEGSNVYMELSKGNELQDPLDYLD